MIPDPESLDIASDPAILEAMRRMAELGLRFCVLAWEDGVEGNVFLSNASPGCARMALSGAWQALEELDGNPGLFSGREH